MFGIPGIVDTVVNTVKSYFPPDLSPQDKAKLEEQLEASKATLQKQLLDYQNNVITQKSNIITAEAKGDSWIQKSWRPITMLIFAAVIANDYLIYPYLSLFIHNAPLIKIPQEMWELLKIGLGGYIVGRSVEKGVKSYSENKYGNKNE